MSPADRPRKSDDVDGGWAKRAARKQEARRDAASGKPARESESYAGSRGAQRKSDSPRKPLRSDKDSYRNRDDRRFAGKSTRGAEKPGGGKPAGGRAGRETGYGAGRSEAGRTGYGRADRSAQTGKSGAGRERAWDDRSAGRSEGRGGSASGADDFGRRRSQEPGSSSSGGRRSGETAGRSGGYGSEAGAAGRRGAEGVSA
ncbi:hypothetical protein ACWDPW_10895, partial [Nocardia xishanensis]